MTVSAQWHDEASVQTTAKAVAAMQFSQFSSVMA
jgi:hypothetical protein